MGTVFFIGTLFSTIAVLATLFDWVLGTVPLEAIFFLSVVLSVVLHRISNAHPRVPSSVRPWIWPSVFLVIFLYLLTPTFPHFLPLSRSWDGANHLVIATHLTVDRNHIDLVRSQFELWYGGGIWSYPWGFHAIVATISGITGIAPVFLIYPFAVFCLAGALAFLGFLLMKKGAHWFSAGLIVLFILIFRFAFPAVIYNNYWSQCLGLFFTINIAAIVLKDHRHFSVAVLTVQIAGLILAYPLYFVFLFPGLIYIALSRDRNFLFQTLTAVAIAAVLCLPAYLPAIKANLLRIGASGPVLWDGFRSLTDWIIVAFYLITLPVGFFLLTRHHRQDMKMAFGSVSFGLLLILFRANHYWYWKWTMLNFFFLSPAVAFLLDRTLVSPIERWIPNRSGRSFVFLGIYALFLVGYRPIGNLVFGFEPAMTISDVNLEEWLDSNKPGANVFYLAPKKLTPWLESIGRKTNVLYTPDMVTDIRTHWNVESSPGKLASVFKNISEPGDILCVRNKIWNVAGIPMNLVHSNELWRVYERNPVE